MNRRLAALPYAHWYAAASLRPRMPLATKLDQELPLPDMAGWTVRWPEKYAFPPIAKRLDPLRAALGRFARVTTYDSAKTYTWHRLGGFPVNEESLDRLGLPGHPKNSHDLRGEVIMTAPPGGICQTVAVDVSDYPFVSRHVLDTTDLYFKCSPAPDLGDPKVLPLGFFPANANMLAVARWLEDRWPARRRIGVFGRFGKWTDAQPYRAELVERMRVSDLPFVGGFGEFRPYPAYLHELRQAHLALEAPGQAAVSYRFVEAMALGAIVVARPPKIGLPEPLVPGTHYLPLAENGGDVVKVCHDALKCFSEDRWIEMRIAAARYFNRNFSAESMARRILRAATEDRTP
jgi:hypothetical protein